MNRNDQIRVYLTLFLSFLPSVFAFATHCHFYLKVGGHPHESTNVFGIGHALPSELHCDLGWERDGIFRAAGSGAQWLQESIWEQEWAIEADSIWCLPPSRCAQAMQSRGEATLSCGASWFLAVSFLCPLESCLSTSERGSAPGRFYRPPQSGPCLPHAPWQVPLSHLLTLHLYLGSYYKMLHFL